MPESSPGEGVATGISVSRGLVILVACRVRFIAQRAVTALPQRTQRRGTETHRGTATAKAFSKNSRRLQFLCESLCHVSVSSVVIAVTARCGTEPARAGLPENRSALPPAADRSPPRAPPPLTLSSRSQLPQKPLIRAF